MGLRSKLRSGADRFVGATALVLIYHRVIALERDPQALAVTPEHFEQHMRVLAEQNRAISLDELIEALDGRRVPDGAVVVTFDDGYADNLEFAEPILERYKVPATVFVSSGYTKSQQEFWWDELERIVLSPGDLPQRIEIETPAATFLATLADARTYSTADAARDRFWNLLDEPTNGRQTLYRDLAAFLRPLSPGSRETALSALRSLAGREWSTARSTHRPLTAEEVARLDASSVVDVGSHTVHHTVLSARSAEEQREEILSDRDDLACLCARLIRTFSYPYGTLDDYTDETERIVREAGFAGACSNHPGVVKPWANPFRLPRNLVRDWSGEEFKSRVAGWFDGKA